MTSFANYYPELDSLEFDEIIAPLAEFDREIAGVLGGGVETSPGAPVGDETRAVVEAWCAAPERYPFQRVVRHLAARVADHDPVTPFAESFRSPAAVLTELLDRVEGRIREVCVRPLVVSVNHARERGLLRGATPEARYADFVARCAHTSFEDVGARRFPVLHGVIDAIRRHEVAAFRELADRLTADRDLIAGSFGIAADDPVVSCVRPEGDSHNHGRTVSIIEFGSGRRLVYKPRDVSCEAAYVVLARRFDELLGTSLIAPAVLDRDGYGYVEYVPAEPVADIADEFMAACGELGAVLYLLNARDIHFENVVPTRRGPVPVDLETILHPEPVEVGRDPVARDNADDALARSIYGTGLLPLVITGDRPGAGYVDLGFLGGRGDGEAPMRGLGFRRPFTDEIAVELRAQPVPARSTVVNAVTQEEVRSHGDRMAAGFTRVYRAAEAARHACAGLLRELAPRLRIRYLHNPTVLYAQTLRMSAGAQAMADAGTHLALLKRVAVAGTTPATMVRAEMRQLAERDVPYFAVAATGVELTSADGTAVGVRLARSPLDSALAKLAGLGEPDLRSQLRLIRSAFDASFPDNHLPASAGERPPAPVSVVDEDGPLAELADELADELVATSRPDRYDRLPRTWIGPLVAAQADRPWPPGVLGYDLFAGRTGAALALAAAGRAVGNPEALALADQIFSATAAILADATGDTREIRRTNPSVYTGLSGVLFALATAGRLLGRTDWVATAQGAVPLVLDKVRMRPPDTLDVIGGPAGVVPCVLVIGGTHRDRAVEELVTLLTGSSEQDEATLRQSGFAHGVSGVIHALSRAHPFLPAARRAEVEATLTTLAGHLSRCYEPAERDWYTNADTRTRMATGWCHGAPGIALGLVAYRGVRDDDWVRKSLATATGNLRRQGFGRNLTWCHGDLGNHDVLTTLAAADTGGSDEARAVEHEWLRAPALRQKLTDRHSRYAHTQSLLVGTAGVLLHLANRLDPAARVSPIALTCAVRP